MKALLEPNENEKIDDLLSDCLQECYHLAILSAMDSIPPEWLKPYVEYQCKLILHYIETKTEFADEQEHSTQLQKSLDEKSDALGKLRNQREVLKLGLDDHDVDAVRSVPLEPEERLGVIVVCDLVSSTDSLLRMDFAERELR